MNVPLAHLRLATLEDLPALLLDRDCGSIRPVRSTGGMLIGAVADATFEACETLLRPGQTLLLYTDGIVEARPEGTTTFGEPALRLSCPSGPDCLPVSWWLNWPNWSPRWSPTTMSRSWRCPSIPRLAAE